MANVSFVKGLTAVDHLLQSGTTGRVNEYYIPSSDGTAVYVGDAVKSAGSADSVTGCPTVAQAAASDTLRGVVVAVNQVKGITPANSNLTRSYRPASVGMYVWVNDDPYTIFAAAQDAVGGAIALVDIGENADLIVGSGDNTTGYSGMQVDSSTHTTSSAQVRIIGFVNSPGNTPASTTAQLRVVINKHELKSTSGV